MFPIEVPLLREPPEDNPFLANHFALRAATRFGTPPRISTPEEVAKALGVAAPLAPGRAAPAGPLRAVHGGPGDAAPGERFATLDEAMARHIQAALARSRGRIEGAHGAARLLAFNPHTLRARMRKLGIDWRRFRDPETRAAGGRP